RMWDPERLLDVLAHRDAVEQRRGLEHHGHSLADGEELLLPEASEILPVEDNASLVGVHEPDEALEEHALAGARAADDGERLAPAHLEREVVEHDLRAEGLVEALEADQHPPGGGAGCRRGHRVGGGGLGWEKNGV